MVLILKSMFDTILVGSSREEFVHQLGFAVDF
jgi:hypothetical protein